MEEKGIKSMVIIAIVTGLLSGLQLFLKNLNVDDIKTKD